MLRFTLALATLLAACAPADPLDELAAEDAKADRLMAPTAPTFYTAARDGKGWLVQRVGRATTTCADGSAAPACRATGLDLAALGLAVEEERAALDAPATLILRGKLRATGVLVVDEAFRNPSAAPAPTLYQLSDRGLRCIAAPCFGLIAEKLNSTVQVTLSGLEGARAAEVEDELAFGPVLVTGSWRTVKNAGPAGDGRLLAPAQLWTRLEPADPARCSVDADCAATAYARPVASPADCYCPDCEDGVVNRASAEAYRGSWERHCANVRLACGGEACVAPRAVACVAARCTAE